MECKSLFLYSGEMECKSRFLFVAVGWSADGRPGGMGGFFGNAVVGCSDLWFADGRRGVDADCVRFASRGMPFF